jgi:aryl-alcohol dehydrogenase-like predicted oxidoreductase
MRYGITNAVGRIDDVECAAIIAVAHDAGITNIDSAAGYGDAQVRLQPWAANFNVTTKISGSNPTALLQMVEASLMDLGVEHVEGVLLHDWEALNAETQARGADAFSATLERGLASSVGVSTYEEQGIDSALRAFATAGVRLGVVQVPGNPLDQRLVDCAALRALQDQGTRVQVRSVFLQGLLAGPSDAQLASHPDVRAFHQFAADTGVPPLAAALAHVRSLPWADEIVVGVTTAEELREIVEAWNGCEPMRAPAHLASEDLELIDPRRW